MSKAIQFPNTKTNAIDKRLRLFGAVLALTGALAASPSWVQAQTPKPPANPTAVPRSKWVTLPIKFGKLQPYTHSTEWFEAQIPDNWKENDTSTSDTAIVSFSDPTENGAVTFIVFANTEELSKDDMVGKLNDYVKTAFGKLTKFSSSGAKPIKTLNGAGQGFSYRQKLSDSKTVTMYGDAYYEQHDSKLVSIIVLLLPEEQYVTVKDQAYKLVNSFKALPENYKPDESSSNNDSSTSDASNTSSDFSIGDLIDYKDSAGYKLRVPESWTRKTGKTNNLPYVTWSDDSGQGILTAISTPVSKASSSTELQKAATEFVKGYAQGNKKLSDLTMGKSAVVDKNSAMASFTYMTDINGESVEMAAVVLVRQSSKAATFVLLVIPKASTENNADAVDGILSSLTVS